MARTRVGPRLVSRKGPRKNLQAKANHPNRPPSTQNSSAPRARRRKRSGMKALREIRNYQKSVDLLIPKLPFARVCREIVSDLTLGQGMKFQGAALLALQEATEAFMVKEFTMVNLAAIHARRVTIQQKDVQFIEKIREIMTGTSFRPAEA